MARRLNWSGLAGILSGVHLPTALAASALTPVLIFLLAVRWGIFLRRQSVPLPLRTVFPLTWAGQFFNSVLPGSTGGDVVKIYQLCRMFPDRKAASAASVIIDRLSALVALALLAGFSLLAGPCLDLSQFGLSLRSTLFWLAGLLAAGAIAVLLLLRMPRMLHWFSRLRHLIPVLKTGFTLDRGMALAVAMAFAIHFTNFTIFYLFARSLGVAVTYFQLLLVLPIVMIAVLAPVTINGHGLREVLLIFYFTQMHIAPGGFAGAGIRETVVAITVLVISNELLWSLPGGLWYLARFRGASAPAMPRQT